MAHGSDAKRVIIAVDGSEQAEQAVQYYVDNLHQEGNHVILLHVVELPEIADMESMRKMMLSPHSLIAMWEEETAKSKTLETKFREMMHAKGIQHVSCHIEGGMKPGQVIVTAATRERATMVVMGTRVMGKIRRTLLGSVSDFVVHHAHCPIVICRH